MSRLGKGLGVLGAVAAGVDAGINKWYRDSGRTDLSTTERVGRSIISGVTTAAGSFVGGYYGAAARAALTSETGPGAIADGAIGAGVGGRLGGGLGTAGGDVLGDLRTKWVDW